MLAPLGSAEAIEQTTSNLGVNATTIKQTQPSGLDIDYVVGGSNIDGLNGTSSLGSKQATATTFTPTAVSRTTQSAQMEVDFQGCTRPTRNNANYCTNRGTLTMNFEHPTTDPTIHLSGLGGSLSSNGQALIYSAALRPTGATPAGTLLSGNNLEVSGGYIQAANVKTGGSCSTVITSVGDGFDVDGGSTAGCGSVKFSGAFSQLTFGVDMRAVCVTQGASNCNNGILNTIALSDQLVMVTTTGLDFGDAPASYNAGDASRHASGTLRLGSTAPINDDGGGLNPTASPVAIAAGADANGANGDGSDEDAFTTLPDVIAQGTQPYPLTVPIGGTAKAGTVAGWIDFNQNNVFDSGERAATSFNAGATSVSLSFAKPGNLTPGRTYARFRTMFGQGLLTDANGAADSGEAEDYSLNIANETASLDFTKSVGAVADTNGDGIDSAGDMVTYTFAITNAGNTTVNAVAIADPKIAGVTCPATTLASGATTSCTGTYTLTQANVSTGNVSNTATATGTTVNGTAVTKTSTANRSVTQVTRASLTKTAGTLTDPDGNGPDVGDTIPYSFVVTNTGNVPLTAASVADPKIAGVTCPAGTLAPGAAKTCTGTYTLTQTDVNAGKVHNSATATVTSAAGSFTTPAATSSKTFTPTSSFTFDKQAPAVADLDGNGPDVGDTITYLFVFSNTGSTTLNTPSVTDTRIGTVACGAGIAEPGNALTCAKVYTLTQTDVDSGAVNNTATGVIKNPVGTNLTSQTDSTSTTVAPSKLVKLTKTAGTPNLGADNWADPGDTITYTFVIENTGASTLTSPTVNDPKVGAVTCATGALAPRASVSCTKAYPLTQADIDAGTVSNTATASGTEPAGTTVVSLAATADVKLERVTVGSLDKAVTGVQDVNGNGATDAGDTITYTFAVTNTGNTTLDPVAVSDPKVGSLTCPSGSLPPGDTIGCSPKVYTVSSRDVLAGAVQNTATSAVTGPDGVRHESQDSTSTSTRAHPVARDDITTGKQGAVQSVNPLANDTAGRASSLTLLDAAGEPKASVEVEGGIYTIEDGLIVFTPEAGFVGAATAVRYRFADAEGRFATARYTPTVTPITPVAVNDTSTGLIGEPQSVDPLANDEPGAAEMPLVAASLTLLDANGRPSPTVSVEGGVYVITGGRVVFTPDAGLVGRATPVRYQIADLNGTLTVARYTPTVSDGSTTPTPTPGTGGGGSGAGGPGTGGTGAGGTGGTGAGGTGGTGAGMVTGLTPGDGGGTGSNGIRLLPGTGVSELAVPLGLLGLLMVGVGIAAIRRRADEARCDQGDP